MTTAAPAQFAESRSAMGPWLWGARTDIALFVGSAALALSLVIVGHATGLSEKALPEWGWVAFVLSVDVAHVWSTLYRTYLDGEEVRAHRLRYFGIPVLCYLAGVAVYTQGSLMFWRVLAYIALFHFVRQQVGWVAVYRARSGRRGALDRVIDDTAVYASTLYPVVYWHAHLSSSRFAWFVQGDFVNVSGYAAAVLPVVKVVWLVALAAFAVRQIVLWARTRTLELGKSLVVATTAAIWYVGIVGTNSDFDFTVTNVIVHGVPYFALCWFYAKERSKDAPGSLGSQIVAGGVAAFLGVLVLCAFAEEMAWDKLVWHDRAWLFGSGVELRGLVLTLLVPLLALPQATHYVLDGMLWRRGDTRRLPAQRRAMGFPG